MIEVATPTSRDDLNHVRVLMRAFIAWHRDRHVQDLRLVDVYFDSAAFEKELENLPGDYARPNGDLLLARSSGEPAGCVALRRIDGQICEMKRMFLYPRFHGKGIGRALGEALISRARARGYAMMRLDTSVRQLEAKSLYEKLGFREIAPYYELPAELRDWLVFMELIL